jgi:hypothetical protein
MFVGKVFQDALPLTSFVEPSEYVPFRVNWAVVPGAICCGPLIEIDVRIAGAVADTAAAGLVRSR